MIPQLAVESLINLKIAALEERLENRRTYGGRIATPEQVTEMRAQIDILKVTRSHLNFIRIEA